MADEEKTDVEAVVKKVTALKKAGLPILYIVIMTIVSMPGFWEWLDNTEDKADAKADVSYQLLKAQVDAVVAQVKENREEGKALRDLVTQLLLQRSGRATLTDLQMPPAPAAAPVLRPLPASLDKMADAAMAAAE
jgi:hypothetical protein